MKKEQLAINQYKDQIVETVKNNPVVVIETGQVFKVHPGGIKLGSAAK